MSQKHMLTEADILTITEIVSGCIEPVMVSVNELKVDVKYLKKQAHFTNESMNVIRADLTYAHRRLDHVELAQLDAQNNNT